jgi:pectate lyase
MNRFVCVVIVLACLSPISARGQSQAQRLLDKPHDWFASTAGRTALENILSWQTANGNWPKNVDTVGKGFVSEGKKKPAGTFDNGATTSELRVLARAYRVTGDNRYRAAVMLGLNHILMAQHSNGGWPQYFPLSKKYHRHITFNDGTMIRLVEFLQDVSTGDDFDFLQQAQRISAADAVERSIQCILECQVVVDGKPTVWCAQHDAVTLVPTSARSYEHASLSGAESAGVLKFLMSIDNPTPEIVRAVNHGVAWFETAKIAGYRYQKSKTEPALSADTGARPLWARFYEIGTNRPIFSDRDGIVRYNLDEVGSERRGGYTWYGNWGESVLSSYDKWPHRN